MVAQHPPPAPSPLDNFLAFQQSSDDVAAIQQGLIAIGLPNVVLPDVNSVDAATRTHIFNHVQRVGLAQFYRHELSSIANSLPGVSSFGIPVNNRRSFSQPHFETVALDRTSCRIIAAGAIVAACTGNIPGALILGLWHVISCE